MDLKVMQRLHRSFLIIGLVLTLTGCFGLYIAVFEDTAQFKGTIQPVYRGVKTVWYEPADPDNDRSCFRPGKKLRPGRPESYIGPIDKSFLRGV